MNRSKLILPVRLMGLGVLLVGMMGMVGCSSSMKKDTSPSAPDTVAVESYQEGQIIHVQTRRPVSFEELIQKTKSLDVIYLGEEHHHRHHIDNANKILRTLLAEGRTATITIEMFGWDGQQALDAYVSQSTLSREAFIQASRWKENWGGSFKDYEPLVQFAKDHHLTILAMNPPRPLVRKVARQGLQQALTDPDMVPWGMDQESYPDDPAYQEKLVQQLKQCHGGMSDEDYKRIYQASMFRDEGMAKTIVAYLEKEGSGKGPVVSYTGGGHIQYQLPVPNRVKRRRDGSVQHLSIYMTTFQPDHPEYIDELLKEGIADYLWLTPMGDHGPPMRCGE